MIMWKKYYNKKIKKIIKKNTDNFNTEALFNQNYPIYENNQLFVVICNYLKIDLTNFFINSFNFLELNKYKQLFITLLNFNFESYQKNLKNNIKIFINSIFVLQNIKTKFYQSCFSFLSNNFCQKHDFLIFYVIYFNFSLSNTYLQITDSSGKSKIFYSAGLVDLKGKQKVLKKLVLVKLFNLLTLIKRKFIKNAPVALHFKNVGSTKLLIVKKLKRKFFIKIIKTFELKAYNGCRKKKERRKRQRKKKK